MGILGGLHHAGVVAHVVSIAERSVHQARRGVSMGAEHEEPGGVEVRQTRFEHFTQPILDHAGDHDEISGNQDDRLTAAAWSARLEGEHGGGEWVAHPGRDPLVQLPHQRDGLGWSDDGAGPTGEQRVRWRVCGHDRGGLFREEPRARGDVVAVVVPIVFVLDGEQGWPDAGPVDFTKHRGKVALAGAPPDIMAIRPGFVEILDMQRQQP